jgi:hypothetical protein
MKAADEWLDRFAAAVKKCAGYGPDPKVHVIPSTTSTNKFVVFLGSFSVYDPDVCVTTRVLMSVFQSVAASAKCDVPWVLGSGKRAYQNGGRLQNGRWKQIAHVSQT